MLNNTRILRITATAGTKLVDAYYLSLMSLSSLKKEFFKNLSLIHAILLNQAFAHCSIFLTAASKWNLGLFSFPMWLYVLPRPTKNYRLVSLLNFQLPKS